MDKSGRRVEVVNSAVLSIWLLFLVGLSEHAVAQELDWSFGEHPHPSFYELTSDELTLKFKGLSPTKGALADCLVHLNNDFDVYGAHYPEFVLTGEPDERYRAWKRYVTESTNKNVSLCRFWLPGLELVAERSDFEAAGLRFCGAWPEPPTTQTEKRFYDLISELLANAQTGFVDPLAMLFHTRHVEGLVTLNPDVEYFLRKSLAVAGEGNPEDWDVSPLLPALDADRIAFLDGAVARKDFAAVVETTPPCPAN